MPPVATIWDVPPHSISPVVTRWRAPGPPSARSSSVSRGAGREIRRITDRSLVSCLGAGGDVSAAIPGKIRGPLPSHPRLMLARVMGDGNSARCGPPSASIPPRSSRTR